MTLHFHSELKSSVADAEESLPSAAAAPEGVASAPTFRDVYVEAFTDGFAAELEALRKARAGHDMCL